MSNAVLVTKAWARPVQFTGEEVNLGKFNIPYEGKGRWYINNSDSDLGDIAADDSLVILANGKEISQDYYNTVGITPTPALDITSILEIGTNEVEVKVKDVIGYSIGSSDLYLLFKENIASVGEAAKTDITKAISHYNITKRLNDPCATFAVKFNIPFDPDEFRTGPKISFQLTDTENPDDFEVYNGYIQKVARNQVVGNKTYDITGRDNGYFLTRQNYEVDCTTDAGTQTPILDHLKAILENTDIKIGMGQPALQNINLSNNPDDANFFGGEFKPKWKAIEKLFEVYSKVVGIKKVRWFIGADSTLRWFEVKSNRGQIKPLSYDDDITNVDLDEDATNIVNKIKGYTGSDDTNPIVLEDKDSQAIYGILEGDPITSSDGSDLTSKLQEQLDQKAWPIYSGSIAFTGIKDYECGQQIMLPDDSKYGNIIFTITEITKEGSPASPKTTLKVTTDETAIAPTNLVENIQTIVDKTVDTATVATVTAIGMSAGGTTTVLAKAANSSVNVPVIWAK